MPNEAKEMAVKAVNSVTDSPLATSVSATATDHPAIRYPSWHHVLLAAAITFTIISCLHLNTCIIGNETILPLAYGYLILACLISLSEWNCRQKQNN